MLLRTGVMRASLRLSSQPSETSSVSWELDTSFRVGGVQPYIGERVLCKLGHLIWRKHQSEDKGSGGVVHLQEDHMSEIARERVVLVHMLMKGMPINFGAVLRDNMRRLRDNCRWKYCRSSLLTQFLRGADIVKRRGIPSSGTSRGAQRPSLHSSTPIAPLFTIADRQAHDESWQGHIFGMLDLQLRLGGRPTTDEEMATLKARHRLIESIDDDRLKQNSVLQRGGRTARGVAP
ncbi:hypothetical protein HAX54_050520, partial [Datura stramonium]|nr:hypothetical protein [Datura stramonium]